MKSLKQHIAESKALHQNVNIQENFKFKINRDNDVYAHHPETVKELSKIIKKRFKELGYGTVEEPIDFNDIDVSNITSFVNISEKGLFEDMDFEYIDVSNWDVSNITDMGWMFYGCSNLKSVGDLSNWDVSNVTNTRDMFVKCSSLENLNLSNWDVSKIKDMSRMFYECESLKSVGDISKWDVSNVETMNRMFFGCKILTINDLDNWNIANVERTTFMFKNSGITNIPKWYEE